MTEHHTFKPRVKGTIPDFKQLHKVAPSPSLLASIRKWITPPILGWADPNVRPQTVPAVSILMLARACVCGR